MNKIKLISIAAASLLTTNIWALGTGLSSYPMMSGKKLISSEVLGVTSSGGGVGAQVRYTQKFNKKAVFDAGIGISAGEMSNRFFTGVDYEIFPDYYQQPKVSVKTSLEMAKEFDESRTKLSLAPTVSKGFSFWGTEAYPYFALPLGLSLDSDSKTYESTVSANLGINGNVPLEQYKHLQASAEIQLGLKDSFTSILVGLSYPLQ